MRAEDTLFRTIVDVPKWQNPMQPHEQFVLLGSCFAQNIGERFQGYGLQVTCNPLGVTYNPESIALQVEQALAPKGEPPIFQATGEWRCWWAGTLIGAADREACGEVSQGAFSLLENALRSADRLFITLGTNVCYKLRESGLTVANCHKMPGGLFEEVALDLDCCTDALDRTVQLLAKECPQMQIIFTVSPYRYAKYGYHGSQLAKATLLLAVERMCQKHHDRVSYFPAYEIVMDELRDYRFYADDMIHPSPAAVNYIWQRLRESAMSTAMQQYLDEYEPVRRALLHRPQGNMTPAYAKFRHDMEQRGQELRKKYSPTP